MNNVAVTDGDKVSAEQVLGYHVDYYPINDVMTYYNAVDDADVKALGKTLLIVFALYAPVKVENMILGGGIIRSGGNTKIIMIIDIVGTWCIGIPLCLLAAYVFKWGIVGVYTLLTTEELFRLAVSLIVFNNRSKNSLTSIGTPLKNCFCILYIVP